MTEMAQWYVLVGDYHCERVVKLSIVCTWTLWLINPHDRDDTLMCVIRNFCGMRVTDTVVQLFVSLTHGTEAEMVPHCWQVTIDEPGCNLLAD